MLKAARRLLPTPSVLDYLQKAQNILVEQKKIMRCCNNLTLNC